MMNETTSTVIEKLEKTSPENIVIHMQNRKYLISVPIIKFLAWNAIPDGIKDEKSDAAKKYAAMRTAAKAMIRPFLPDLLKRTWGCEVRIEPRLNILTWLSSYVVHFMINMLAMKEWEIHAESCDCCGEDVYRVFRVSPYSLQSIDPTGRKGLSEKISTARKQEDSLESGGSNSHSGDDGFWENDASQAAALEASTGVSGCEGLHSGL